MSNLKTLSRKLIQTKSKYQTYYNNCRNKTLIKTVTKNTKGEDTEDVYETFFTNYILKNNSVKTAFNTAVKNLRGG